mgnify:CR=1 FL=1
MAKLAFLWKETVGPLQQSSFFRTIFKGAEKRARQEGSTLEEMVVQGGDGWDISQLEKFDGFITGHSDFPFHEMLKGGKPVVGTMTHEFSIADVGIDDAHAAERLQIKYVV